MPTPAPLRPIARRALGAQSDERLVRLVREGHEPAFEEVVRRYRGTLVAFAAVTRRAGTVVETMRTHPVPAVVVGCGTALYQGLYFVSVLLVGVSVATVVSLGLAPVLAAISEWSYAWLVPPTAEGH